MDNSDSEGRGLVGNIIYQMTRNEKYMDYLKILFCLTVGMNIYTIMGMWIQ